MGTTEVRERGILFSDRLVRAILDGRKTQTRRIVRPQPNPPEAIDNLGDGEGLLLSVNPMEDRVVRSPYGYPGDRLYVREAWAWPGEEEVLYRADPEAAALVEKWKRDPHYPQIQWKPSIHMPKKFSRIMLEITGVRVERVQEVTEEDARAEGVVEPGHVLLAYNGAYRDTFRDLWDEINGPRGHGWDANPWVWVLEFKRVDDAE